MRVLILILQLTLSSLVERRLSVNCQTLSGYRNVPNIPIKQGLRWGSGTIPEWLLVSGHWWHCYVAEKSSLQCRWGIAFLGAEPRYLEKREEGADSTLILKILCICMHTCITFLLVDFGNPLMGR